MIIVAEKPVGHRRLRRHRFQGRVAGQRGHGRVEAEVGDAPDADASVVAGGVPEQPVDRIISVAGLVDLPAFLAGVERAQVDEVALRLEAAADVLADEDVAFALEIDRGADREEIGVGPIGRSKEEDRQGAARFILRSEDRGEQADAVPHRNHDVFLVIGRLDPGRYFHLSGQRKRQQDSENRRKQPSATIMHEALHPARPISRR